MAVAQMSSRARTHWTLPALIVLWTLWGIASSYPSRTDATFLEKKWESLFSRSYLGLPGGKSGLNWESDYLQGIKRVRRLYCNVGIGFHLQVLPDGRISGTHNENPHSELLHAEKECNHLRRLRESCSSRVIFNKTRRRG